MTNAYGAVVTSHANPHLSGVAKFNALLADRLGVGCLSLGEAATLRTGPVFLSVKLGDGAAAEWRLLAETLRAWSKQGVSYDLFLHTFDGHDIELELVEQARRVFCGNSEIRHALEGQGKTVLEAWCPPLVDPTGVVRESTLNLFCFGMAHKIQVRHFQRLRDTLAGHRVGYSLWVSTAFHEKARFGDFDSLSRQMRELFGDRIQFLGFLSDEAVNYFLDKSEMFISFFPKGVRANNTSVSAAMTRGRAVLTNLDEHSPAWMRHGRNVLDVHALNPDDLDRDSLRRVGRAARRDASRRAGWEGLRALLTGTEGLLMPGDEKSKKEGALCA
jgi:hypothetical protein